MSLTYSKGVIIDFLQLYKQGAQKMNNNQEDKETPIFDEQINTPKFGPKFYVKIAVILAIVLSLFLFKSSVFDNRLTSEDLKASIEIFDTSSQWLELKKIEEPDYKGIILVPQFSLRIKNIGKADLKHVYILGVFRLVNAPKSMGEDYYTLFSKPLAPGKSSDKVVLTSGFGYRATSKAAFNRNTRNWRSAVVEIYVKSKNTGLTFLKSYYISKRIEGLDIEIKVVD